MRQTPFQRLSNRIRHLKVHLSDNQTMVLLITVFLLVLTNLAVLLILVFPQSNEKSQTVASQITVNSPLIEQETPTPEQILSNPVNQAELYPSINQQYSARNNRIFDD